MFLSKSVNHVAGSEVLPAAFPKSPGIPQELVRAWRNWMGTPHVFPPEVAVTPDPTHWMGAAFSGQINRLTEQPPHLCANSVRRLVEQKIRSIWRDVRISERAVRRTKGASPVLQGGVGAEKSFKSP